MKREELTPIELECNMGPDVNGVVQREPWKAYDIDEVDALLAKKDKEIRRLKRALWLARALRARDIQRWWIAATCAPITERACSVWNNVERKCIKKAEEYK